MTKPRDIYLLAFYAADMGLSEHHDWEVVARCTYGKTID
jgi:hypothetical protein